MEYDDCMNLSTTPVVGIAAEAFWPQVFKHHGTHASFVACFCLKDKKEVREVGKKFLEEIEVLPFDSKVELSAAITALVKKYSSALVSFAAGYFYNSRVLIWVQGDGAVLLKRGEKSGTVVRSTQLKVVDGAALGGDSFVFATAGFLAACPQPFSGEFETDEELAALWIPTIHAQNKDGTASAYVVQIHQQQPIIEAGGSVVLGEGSTATHNDDESAKPNETPLTARERSESSARLPAKLLAFLPGAFRIKPAMPSKRKAVAVGVVVLIALFLVLLFTAWLKNQAAAREQKVQQILQPYQQELSDAKAKQPIDLTAARQLTAQAISDAKQKLNQLQPKSYEATRLSAFIADTQKYYDSISGEKTIDKLPVYYDLQLVKSDFLAQRIAIAPNTLAFLDQEKNASIELTVDKKQPSAPDMSGVANPKDLTLSDSNKIYTLGDGIFQVGQIVVQKDSAWSDPEFLRLFGTNLYVLDKGAKTIFKYVGASDGSFGAGTVWIKSAPGVDFSTATSMAIDGRMWVATSNGNIYVFAQGSKAGFSVKGLSKPFASDLKIYTDSNLDNLYVLEAQAGRVVELGKDGTFKASFTSKDFASCTGIVVTPDGQTAYLSAGSLVYALPLQ
jgi:hypothetical protein